MAHLPVEPDDNSELAFLHKATLHEPDNQANLRHQLVTSPLITRSTLEHHAADFPSRGLLGTSASDRVYVNTNAPNSAVICGVQGSGKSHTVSCLLECALIPDSRIGRLPESLSALVFHFDEREAGRPCEAAFLSSPDGHLNQVTLPKVTVLCSPSNINRRRRAYASQPQVRVEPLYLSEMDLSADRMLALMGCDNLETMPLYMHTVMMLIRDIGFDAFSYTEFKRRIDLERLDGKQRAMITLRLNLLDSFIRPGGPQIQSYFVSGGLVLVDLTDPFLDSVTAGVLFDIVLGTFTQWQTACGKLVVLDEAHKYLVNSDSARLTQSISNIIRLQRHLGTRVIIATQEPTVIPPTILDLASTIICHRFSSPAWCTHLARHVSAGTESTGWFEEVMSLATGHALVFSPAAVISTDERGGVILGRAHLKLKVRPRLTLDGGASILAVGSGLPAPTTSSTASLSSLPTPPTFESHLPGQVETATTIPTTTDGKPFSPPNVLATPTAKLALEGSAHCEVSETTADVKPFVPPNAPSIQEIGGLLPGPSCKQGASAQREVSSRLEILVDWFRKQSVPVVNLVGAHKALGRMGKNDPAYAGMTNQERWRRILDEAVKSGIIELINMNSVKRNQMMRLVDSGPFVYVQ